jgi:cell division transport system permease protein
LLQALRNTASAPISFLLNALVISVAFSLPLMGLTALENLRPLSAKLVTEPEISLFMGMNVSRDTALALQADIQRIVQRLVQRGDRSTDRNRQRSGKIVFKPREAAFAELKQRAGLSDALSVLGDNPLPDGYVITLPPFSSSAASTEIDGLASQLRELKGVDHVQVDSSWIQRLAALSHLLEVVLLLLGAMLGVVVITVVFNTIRLQVLTQREEIAVSQLVGATNGYIVRPFYYAGALLGTAAAAIALGTVAALLYPINTAVADFAHLYASDFALHPLGLATTSLLLLLGAFLGFSGALLSVSRHLSSKVA